MVLWLLAAAFGLGALGCFRWRATSGAHDIDVGELRDAMALDAGRLGTHYGADASSAATMVVIVGLALAVCAVVSLVGALLVARRPVAA